MTNKLVSIVLCFSLWGILLPCKATQWSAFSTKPEGSPVETATNKRPDQLRLVTQFGHAGQISSVAFSPDGHWALTGSTDNTARLWDVATGAELRRFEGHSSWVSSVAFSPDGRFVLTGSTDNTARLWNVATGAELRRFEGHSGDIESVAYSPDGRFVLTGSSAPDKTARLWDVATGAELRRFEGHSGDVESVAYSPDGRFALTGGDTTARLWDVAIGAELRQFRGHSGLVKSVAFSPDERFVLTGSADCTARLWDASSGVEVRRFKRVRCEYAEYLKSVAFSPDGDFVLTGSARTACLWDASTGQELRRFEGLPWWVAFSPDGRLLLIGGGVFARLIDATSGKELRRLGGNWGPIRAIVFSPDGQSLLTGAGGEARLWDVANGANLRRFLGHIKIESVPGVYSVAYSPDGRFVLTGGTDGTTRLWAVATREELRRFGKLSHNYVNWVAFSHDGRFIFSSGSDGSVHVWSLKTGQEIRRFENPGGWPVAKSNDDKLILIGSSSGGARLLDVSTGAELHRFGGQQYGVRSVSFSQDNRFVVTGGGGSIARVWETLTGKELIRLEGHSGSVDSVAFSPDGRFVLTGSNDNTARLWDVTTGGEMRRFEGHSAWLEDVAFSPDGRHILTASWDGTVRIWEPSSGQELCRLLSFRDGSWVVIDPEGRFDASNGGDAESLDWVVGLEPIALHQLKERYYEPGLLAKVLGFNKEPLRNVEAFRNVALYPAIELSNPTVEDPTLGINLTNRGGGIGKVIVSINGKEVEADARGSNPNADAQELQVQVPLDNHPYLIPGKENEIEVRALNAEGYLSSRGVTVIYEESSKVSIEKPTLWAIVAGVSNYAGEDIRLRYAAKDAQAMATALSLGAKRLFGAEKVQLALLSTDPKIAPTKPNIEKAFEKVRNAKPWDILVVYLAGHGLALGDTYYYLTQEARSTDITDPAIRDQATISSKELVAWTKQSPALKQVMVLDTCAAGTAARKLLELRNISSDQIRAIERLKDRTGFHVLMGSASDAVSYEATQYEQGLLTYALLQGMRGAALREEEYIDVSRLFQYAADEVPSLASNIGGIQRPRIAAPKGTSFDIGQLNAKDRQLIPLAQSKPILLPPMLQNADQLFDNLELTLRLRRHLREDAYASLRGDPRRLAVVYVDADQLAGAIRPSGTYRIQENNVLVSLVLVKDGKKLTKVQVQGTQTDLEALTKNIVEALSRTVAQLH